MTGSVTVNRSDEPIEKHTHLRIALADSEQEVRFCDPRRFGGIWFLSGEADGKEERPPGRNAKGRKRKSTRRATLGPIGPEPLELKPREFAQVLRRKRAIKALLMDQAIIAGLGNIYCDESLFAAGIHPLRAAHSLSDEEAKRLLRAVKSTLRRAIKFNGSTLMDYRSADGEPGSFQRFHRVYNRSGEPCRVCKSPIERIIVAGRSSCFCRSCQPLSSRERRPGMPA
jgi:formamidopyrimidine-DNA glycosylase